MPGPTQEACPYFLVEMKLVSVGAWLYLTALENETSFGILRIPQRQTINQNLDQMDGFLQFKHASLTRTRRYARYV